MVMKDIVRQTFQNFKGRKYMPLIDVPLRWGDMDSMSHVNNVQYNVYFEDARCRWFNYKKFQVNPQGKTCLLSDSYAKFRRPALWPDTLTIGVSGEVVDGGRGEFKQHYVAFSHDQKSIIAEGWATIVVVDITKDGKTTRSDIPQNWYYDEDQ